MLRKYRLLWLLSILLGNIAVCYANAPVAATVNASIKKYVNDKETLTSQVNSPHEGKAYKKLKAFYQSRGYRSAFNAARRNAMIVVLKKARNHGLSAENYGLSLVESLAASAGKDASQLAQLDLALANGYLNFAYDLLYGSVIPDKEKWEIVKRKADIASRLNTVAKGGKIYSTLLSLCPKNKGYWKLTEKIKAYHAIADQGGWPAIYNDFYEGESSLEVANLTKRLGQMGDLSAQFTGVSTYNNAVTRAVKKYQKRHGIPVTGEVDATTRNTLNVPISDRIATIGVSLNRFRWMPNSFGSRYVWVNIPEYRTYIMQNRDTIANIISVVGEVNNQTPIMPNKKMINVILSPAWNLPRSIAQEELKYIQMDPSVLVVGDVDVIFDGKKVSPYSIDWKKVDLKRVRLRQKPQKRNSMGQAKFMFSNDHSIFLHDTPNQQDFEPDQRAYSHGCIRLSEPALFANKLLAGWSMSKVKKVMNGGKETYLRPGKSTKVHVFYLTSWVDNSGNLQFRHDVYGHDSAQMGNQL